MIPTPALFLIGALSAGSRPFFQKGVLTKISSAEFIALQILILIIISIIVVWKNKTFTKLNTFTKQTWMFLFASMVVTLLSAYIYFTLLKNSKPSLVVAILSPLTIVFTIIIGRLFFEDKLTVLELVGIFLIIVGVVLTQIKLKHKIE